MKDWSGEKNGKPVKWATVLVQGVREVRERRTDDSIRAGVCKLFFKGPNINILNVLSHNYSTLSCSEKAAIDNTSRNELGCVPIKLYFWTLKF